jgi:Single-strand binding protein family.
MPNLNQVNLIGNCTRDPELRYTPKGLVFLLSRACARRAAG